MRNVLRTVTTPADGVPMAPAPSRRIRDEGFTLVEMLVVVLILGMLASVAVIGISGVRRSATVEACQTDWQSLSSAVQSYGTDHLRPGTALPDYTGLAADAIGVLTAPGEQYLHRADVANAYIETVTVAVGGDRYSIGISAPDGSRASVLPDTSTAAQAATACGQAIA